MLIYIITTYKKWRFQKRFFFSFLPRLLLESDINIEVKNSRNKYLLSIYPFYFCYKFYTKGAIF